MSRRGAVREVWVVAARWRTHLVLGPLASSRSKGTTCQRTVCPSPLPPTTTPHHCPSIIPFHSHSISRSALRTVANSDEKY
ncbi:hypothetical protein E2C01_095185 [Portunus trituberculatus]|uniref:Uncharacterized protein n=1 Tax=Portunus trituberculatus TaxID=210409 RepID=A0A5B7JP65_PORTR|nr:hypothetical protein [Portunus trituberculatus]